MCRSRRRPCLIRRYEDVEECYSAVRLRVVAYEPVLRELQNELIARLHPIRFDIRLLDIQQNVGEFRFAHERRFEAPFLPAIVVEGQERSEQDQHHGQCRGGIRGHPACAHGEGYTHHTPGHSRIGNLFTRAEFFHLSYTDRRS